MTDSKRLLLDCDPGIDDAFAIFCACRFADLVAVTTVSGNVRIEHTTRNALHVLDLAGVDVPVHPGAAAPLSVPPMFADEVHGSTGLGATATPQPRREPSNIGAVEAIIDFCESEGAATIVATGPLTNVASALLEHPSLTDSIEALHWMGGSTTVGNKTPHAEFNAWADPHAVDVVFRSGVPVTMYGLNLTHQVRMTDPHIEELAASDSVAAQRSAEFLAYYREQTGSGETGQAMHDPCALLGFTHPALFAMDESRIVAHVEGERRGMTEEVAPGADTPTHTIARVADARALLDLIVTAAASPSGAR